MRGFYKGFLPNAIRYVPATCITLMTVEYMIKFFRDEQADLDGVLLRSICGPDSVSSRKREIDQKQSGSI